MIQRALSVSVVAVMTAILSAAPLHAAPPSLEARLLEAADRGAQDPELWAEVVAHGGPRHRVLAVRTIAAVADPAWLPRLVQVAGDPSGEVRQLVMVAAGRLGAAASDLVEAGLDDPAPAVRSAAAWAACQLGGVLSQPVLDRLEREQEPAVLSSLLTELWRLEGASWVEPASGFASHADSAVRRGLAFSLARSQAEGRAPLLQRLANDADPAVRALAIRGLTTAEPEEGQSAQVLAALEAPEPAVLTAACEVLAAQAGIELGEEDATRVRRLVSGYEPQLAAAALRAAGAHPGIMTGAELHRLATESEPWLASEALAALVAVEPGAAAELAASWLGSPEPWQRRAAATVTARLDAEVRVSLEETILKDPEPGVRLAWLEALTADRLAGLAEILWSLVFGDDDPAVRTEAVEDLARLRTAANRELLLGMYRAWKDDSLADARATALAMVMQLAADDDGRKLPLALASADPDPGVAALMAVATARRGLDYRPPPRRSPHPVEWYTELVGWAAEPHWLDVVTTRGAFRIALDSRTAPLTARALWDHATAGGYDGLTFHRVVPNFVVQGGDPRGDGWGSGGMLLVDEPSLAPFVAGRVGVATSGPNTGGCQLFVTLLEAAHLTGHYTNFGEVVAGREVVDRLAVGDRIIRVKAVSGAEPPPIAPTLLGPLSWQELAELDGWSEEHETYAPDEEAVSRLRSATSTYHVIAVLGTWCEDSEREVPRLQRVLDDVGGSSFSLTMIGVDRGKRAYGPELPPGLLAGQTAELVPTIIVLDELGLELGRVVETAAEPLEQLLVQLVAPVEGW